MAALTTEAEYSKHDQADITLRKILCEAYWNAEFEVRKILAPVICAS